MNEEQICLAAGLGDTTSKRGYLRKAQNHPRIYANQRESKATSLKIAQKLAKISADMSRGARD